MEANYGKKILVVGKNSYIGTSFINYMGTYFSDEGWEIDAISVRDNKWKAMSFQKYDCILYGAGIAHQRKPKGKKERQNHYYVNCQLALALAKKAAQDGVGQFLYISSMSVYGLSQGTITLDTIPKPKDDYGKSKFLAEKKLSKVCQDKLRLAIIRPPMVYGKGCKGNYPKLSHLARSIFLFPNVCNQRSQIYIDNLSEFLRNIIANEEEGTFFPQNQEYVRTSNLVKEIAKIHGKKLILLPGFEKIIEFFSRKNVLVGKVFGNLVYEKSMSKTGWHYQVKDWKESIEKTESNLVICQEENEKDFLEKG